jgi:iron complex transport system substrate-binding protein
MGPPAAIALAIILAIISSCSRSDAGSGRTATDLAGRKVRIPDRVERLIALGPGALRLVTYLEATDRIVGIEDIEKRMDRGLYARPYASVLDEEFLNLPVVGAGGPGVLPDPERVLTCRPDLIVAVSIDPGQLDNLQAKTGVPAVYLSYGELGVWREESRRSLSLLGELLGRSERAAAINGYIAALEADLAKRTRGIPEQDRPSAYFGGVSYKGVHGLASTEAEYPPAQMARARNLADTLDESGHLFLDMEQILAWNPDFIFIDISSRPVLDLDYQRNRSFYRLLRATRCGQVLSLLPYNHYNTNIELALLNAYFVGKSLYPDRFADVTMKDKADEIMQTFVGVRAGREIPAFRVLRFPATGPVEWR